MFKMNFDVNIFYPNMLEQIVLTMTPDMGEIYILLIKKILFHSKEDLNS